MRLSVRGTRRGSVVQVNHESTGEHEEISTAIDLRGRPTDSAPTMIFEAKTLGTRRETPRIRSGLAQLLEYRFLHGTQNDELCLVLSRQLSLT